MTRMDEGPTTPYQAEEEVVVLYRNSIRNLIAQAVALATLTAAARAGAALTYYVDESTDFTGNGCEASNVNTITATLQTAMNSRGWSGVRYTEALAYPQDFREACSTTYGTFGSDDVEADFRMWAVYAGHGSVGGGDIWFGYPHLGSCQDYLNSNMRLGSMAGHSAGAAAYFTSCTLKISTLGAQANHEWVWQNMGFHNSPTIGGNGPRDFFECTGANTNAYCWLSHMEGSGNSPIVVSYGSTATEAQTVQSTAALRQNRYISTPRANGPTCGQGQPGFWYTYTYIDNGSGPC